MNNCLCNLFNDSNIWLIIIALLIIFTSCGNSCSSCGGGCGCGCGN